MSARETALCALIACRKDGAWSNSVLKEYAQRDGLDSREAALAARLCYGVLQNRGKLDFYLKQLLRGKLKDLHPAVRDILHLGLYQLYEMDKIPASAAVNESVCLAKKYCKKIPNAAPLVNGVLRNAVRTLGTLQKPTSYADLYSHPQKLVDILKESVGKERLQRMLQANNEAVPTVVQVNTLRTDTNTLCRLLEQEGVSCQKHPWLPDCLILSGTGSMELLETFRKGLFYVQDAAARLSVLCARLKPGMHVLDCCAAPGGKSFAAALEMSGSGQITSCDIHPHKITLIQNGIQRLGLSNVEATLQDAAETCPDWIGKMDAVIADVPCSGYGIIRKKPDIRYKDPDTMLQLPQLQRQILGTQARYVKPGGVLLYSTCTVLQRENEDVVATFLQENNDFYLEKLELPVVFPAENPGYLTLVPGEYDTDGFFICRLRRKL